MRPPVAATCTHVTVLWPLKWVVASYALRFSNTGRELSRQRISTEFASDEAGVLTLARRHRLTVYDAAYLELALREGVPLATLDGPLANAARTEGVPVLGE